MRFRETLVWVFVSCLLATTLLAQEAAPESPEEVAEEGAYIETVEVNVVNVDVFVTDREGNPYEEITTLGMLGQLTKEKDYKFRLFGFDLKEKSRFFKEEKY